MKPLCKHIEAIARVFPFTAYVCEHPRAHKGRFAVGLRAPPRPRADGCAKVQFGEPKIDVRAGVA